MQRNSTYQNIVKTFFWFISFVFYSSLTTIYTFLPPMIGVLFILLKNSLSKYSTDNDVEFFAIFFAIFIIEIQKGFLPFSLIVFFLIIYKTIVPKIEQNIGSNLFKKLLYIIIIYFGYYFFSLFISKIFMIDSFSFDPYIMIYIIIEFIIVGIFL